MQSKPFDRNLATRIQTAGIKALPSIINACLVTSAWSAASSDLYTSSRAIYGLALARQAPKVFAKTSKGGLPYVAVGFSALFTTLAYMAINSGAGRVFGWFANMVKSLNLIDFHS